jgi:ubiquinone/menaquinone biosynthesis C-methylase UbiE
MIEKYVSDSEYRDNYFLNLNNLRGRIADDLQLKPGIQILDLATGGGYFAAAISGKQSNINIKGIDISKRDIDNARKTIEKFDLSNRVEILRMDAINMSFSDSSFDMVVNFLGLEDIHMTRGEEGIRKTFSEVNRVLKHGCMFYFVAMPPEEMETKAQKTEVELFSYICDATWLSSDKYETIIQSSGFKLLYKKSYFTGMKLTAEQARDEIRFACDNIPRIYGITVQTFEDTWARFGGTIKKYGLGHYSKVVLFAAKKIL